MQVINPRTLMADAIGVSRGSGTPCAVCTNSPFDVAGTVKTVLRSTFTATMLLDRPDLNIVCTGCKVILGGKHGTFPPPLRAKSFAIAVDESPWIRWLEQEDWWPILLDPDLPPTVLSWSETGKRQHHLSAMVSGAGAWRVGSDNGCIMWRHRPELLEAIQDLRDAGVSKARIISGKYAPRWRAKHQGLAAKADEVLDSWRGSRVLALLAYASPGLDEVPKIGEEEPMPISSADEWAVEMLAILARSSARRSEDGLRFWGTFYDARIARFSRLPLVDFISRLITEIGASTTGVAPAVKLAGDLNEQDAAAVMDAIRSRRAALIALAFDRLKTARDGIATP